jgi:hypothetical protein
MVSNLLIYAYCLLILLILGVILKQGLSRNVDLFSLRNLYLAGFCIYQLSSPALALETGNFWFFDIVTPEKTGKEFFVLASLYLMVFLFSYHKIKLSPKLAKVFSGPPQEVSDYLLICLAGGLMALAVPMRFMPIPAIAKPSVQVAIAFAGITSAICGWVWSSRRSNIPLTIFIGFLVFASVLLSVTSTMGRRPLIGVAMGFVWGVYQRRARWQSPGRLILSTMPFILAAAVAISAFTAIRSREGVSGQENLSRMAKANIKSGAMDILAGQSCGSASLWAIENWPETFETRKLYSLKIMAYWWVPRGLWPEKPAPLGNDVARLAKVDGVNWYGMTIPPGVIGYIAAEGGMLALVIYGVFFGQFLRLFDDLVRLNPTNVYIILPVGCCLGQVLGLARGCIAIFTNLFILGFIATFLILYVVNKLFGHRIREKYTMAWPQYH